MPKIDNIKDPNILDISELKEFNITSLVPHSPDGSLSDSQFLSYATGLDPLPGLDKLTKFNFGNGVVILSDKTNSSFLDAECLIPFLDDPLARNYALGGTGDGTFVLETPLRDSNEDVIISVFDSESKSLSMALYSKAENKLKEITPDNAVDVFSNINTLVAKLSSSGYFGDDLQDIAKRIYELKKGRPDDTDQKSFEKEFKNTLDKYISEMETIYLPNGGNVLLDLSKITTTSKDGIFESGQLSQNINITSATGERKFSYFNYASAAPEIADRKIIDYTNLANISDFYGYQISDETREYLNDRFFIVMDWMKLVLEGISSHKKIDQYKIENNKTNFLPYKVYCKGTPGDGKSSFSDLCSKIAGMKYVSTNITPETTGDQLLTRAKLEVENGIMSSNYELSQILAHIEEGNVIVCIEEADIAAPGVLVALNQLWAEGKTTVHTQDGDRLIKCGPNVVFWVNANGSLDPSTESRFSDQHAITVRTTSLPWNQALETARHENFQDLEMSLENEEFTIEEFNDFISDLQKLQGFITTYNDGVRAKASRKKSHGQGSEIISNLIDTRFAQKFLKYSIQMASKNNQGLHAAAWSQFSDPDSQLMLRLNGDPDFANLVKLIEPILNK